jgi:hypothetical protein
MPTVPDCAQAIVEPTKVAAYLLSRTHPIGRGKARFFKRFGFREDAPDALMQALLAHVNVYEVAHTESFTYGIKYRVDGPLDSPDRRNPRVSTVWIVRRGETTPRFVTAFPC